MSKDRINELNRKLNEVVWNYSTAEKNADVIANMSAAELQDFFDIVFDMTSGNQAKGIMKAVERSFKAFNKGR